MFEVGFRQQRLVRAAYDIGFKYHAGSVWPNLFHRRLIDGGLLILSRYPIVERGQKSFTLGSGSDGICAKGVLYARIQLSPDLADSLHVFTTHTQAGDRAPEYNIRAAQLVELKEFVATTLREDPYAPFLLTGDFNMDARHDLAHDLVTNGVFATACEESQVYQSFYNELFSVLAAGRTLLDLMKAHDTSKLTGHLHPITNGDGHATLLHTTDPLSIEKDGKCIDYMFFSPGIRARRSISGDIPSLSLSVVEHNTTVDHGSLDKILHTSDHGLPITHLSDHYGLKAEFALEITPVKRPDGTEALPRERLCDILQLYFPPHAFLPPSQHLGQWKVRFLLLLIVLTGGSAVVLVPRMIWRMVFG